MYTRPTKFIWCGVLFIPGRSDPSLFAQEFYGTLSSKMLSLVDISERKGYTVDLVTERFGFPKQDKCTDTFRVRDSCCLVEQIEEGDVFLKPDYDCVGHTIVQMVAGSKKFLKAASRELRVEYGWPEHLAGDAESCVNDLTIHRCVATFIRPKMADPFILPITELKTDMEETAVYLN